MNRKLDVELQNALAKWNRASKQMKRGCRELIEAVDDLEKALSINSDDAEAVNALKTSCKEFVEKLNGFKSTF